MEKRIIKFRGKRINNGEWVYGDLWQNLTNPEKPVRIICYWKMEGATNTSYDTRVIPESVGQYTGANDANNTELYEDDIFEDDAIWYKIYWCESMLCWDCINIIDSDNINLCEFDRSPSCFKQGNIHDNPELITK